MHIHLQLNYFLPLRKPESRASDARELDRSERQDLDSFTRLLIPRAATSCMAAVMILDDKLDVSRNQQYISMQAEDARVSTRKYSLRARYTNANDFVAKQRPQTSKVRK